MRTRIGVCTLYLHTFVVSGKGTFPLDMLRYDGCSPAFEGQVHMLDELANYKLEVRSIVVKRFTCQMADWTPDRWASFGWRFDGPFMEPNDARRTVRAKLQADSVEQHFCPIYYNKEAACPFCELKKRQGEEKRLAVNQQAVFDSLTELVNSPNMKSNAMWDRAVAALRPAKEKV